MYSMVLMAALTTGTDMPDFGRRGGRGCHGGCYGGMYYGGCYGGWGGCYGGYGMGYGGWGGCYGGFARGGWGGCYGGGWGGCYGGGWGGGYGYGGGYVLGGFSPWSGYAMTPMTFGSGTLIAGNTLPNTGTQSFYFNPGTANQGNEATIIVHLPADATLTVDGQPTQSHSGTRVFTSPPLNPGRTYSYTLRAEVNRDGRMVSAEKTVEVRAGQPTEVDLNYVGSGARGAEVGAPADGGNFNPGVPARRTPPVTTPPPQRTIPAPPR